MRRSARSVLLFSFLQIKADGDHENAVLKVSFDRSVIPCYEFFGDRKPETC